MLAGTRLDAFTSNGVRCLPQSTLDPRDTVDAFGSVAPTRASGGVGGVGGQRRLHLLFGAWIFRAGVYAQLDKSSTAQVVMGAVCRLVRVAQQKLIHPQLSVFLCLLLRGTGRGCLEVDRHQSTVVVFLDAIEVAPQVHRLWDSCGGGDVKVRDDVTLAVDEGSLASLVIDQESLECMTGFGSFGHRTPRCVEVDLTPHLVNESLHGAQVFGDLSTRDVVGNRVHDASECRRARANNIGVRFVVEEPLHRALPDRIQRGSGQRNGRIGGPQRTGPLADIVHAPPVGWIRGRDQRRARSVTKGGDASQERCRVPSRVGRGIGIHQGAPTVDHQLAPTGDHVTAVRQGFDGDARRMSLVVVAWVAEIRADHVRDEPARSIRSLICRVDGEQGDLLAGTGHCHEKQVALLAHEIRGHLICRGEFLYSE